MPCMESPTFMKIVSPSSTPLTPLATLYVVSSSRCDSFSIFFATNKDSSIVDVLLEYTENGRVSIYLLCKYL